LRYVPHGAARSLITRRTQTIGALLPDLHGEFFSELIRGVDLAARARGLHLLVSSSHGDASEAAAALRAMQGRVDGLLVMSPHVDASFLSNHLPIGLPIVLLNTPIKGGHYAALNIDNFGGAYAMVRHLVERGHRRIALIAGPENTDAAGLRNMALGDGGICPSGPVQVLPGGLQESGAVREAVARTEGAAAGGIRPNDIMAAGCLFALREAGVRVPQDIALAGFDDIPIAHFVSPPLTTVRVRIADLGARALGRLAAIIEDSAAERDQMQMVDTELVVRQSCGKS
jgi:LacI family transcriptional regulator